MLKSDRRQTTTTTIKYFKNGVFIFLNPQCFETSQAFETVLAVTSGNKNKFDFSKIVLVRFQDFSKEDFKEKHKYKNSKIAFSMFKQRCLAN